MKVFVVYDGTDRAYPIVGIFSSLALAKAASMQQIGWVPRVCGIYEEELDGVTFDPVFHEMPENE